MNSFSKFLHTNRKLGMRIIKTGIAVTVCVAISSIFKLDLPFIAVIATVMSMGKSIDTSLRSGKNKMIGALIGAVTGGCFAMLLPANAGLCGVGVIIVLYLCHLFKLDEAGTLSSVLFAAIMFGAPLGAAWQYALTCGIDALIGIAIAVIINFVVFPPNYADEIKKLYADLTEKVTGAVKCAKNSEPVDLREIETIVEQILQNINLYISEAKLLRWNDEEIFEISNAIKTHQLILDELKTVASMGLTEKDEPPAEILTVYNYHINKIENLYEKVLQRPKSASGKPVKKFKKRF